MSLIHFHTALGGSILRLWRGPSPRAYSWCGFTLFSFHSASRIHPVPLTCPFSKGLLMERIHSLFLSFRLEDPSCAFGAALLQGPTHGADSLSFPFIPPRGSILRLWRGPSPRVYSWSGFTLFSFHTALGDPSCAFDAPLLQEPAANSSQKEKSQLSLTLFRDRVSSREADIGHCFFLPPR